MRFLARLFEVVATEQWLGATCLTLSYFPALRGSTVSKGEASKAAIKRLVFANQPV
jgi:hypothetical protein